MFSAQENQVFDAVLKARRSCRGFTDQVPSKEDIEAIIEAGTLAPYAGLSAFDVEVFRHYYVFTKDSSLYPAMDALIRSQSETDLATLLAEKEHDPIVQQYGKLVESRKGAVAKNGVPAFPNPPCLIVMAEWRGPRKAERQGLAHALQNMWLKATALGLDFGILSIFESMSHNEEFCKLFDLPVGHYGFHGCVVGYRKVEKLAAKSFTAQTHWLT